MDNYDKVETNSDGDIIYLKGNIFHRLDGPAIIYANGDQRWYKNGKRHREEGPAICDLNHLEWFIEGTPLSEQEFLILKINNFLK